MKKIILLTMLIISIGNSGTLQDFYESESDNRLSSYLEKEMEDEAMRCSQGSDKDCIALGIGSLATSLARLDTVLIGFLNKRRTYAQKKIVRVLRTVKKKRSNKKKKSKSKTKAQIIWDATISGKNNLKKTGIYKIIFKDGSSYIGIGAKQTIGQRLRNRSKKWLLTIKSIRAKYYPATNKEEIDTLKKLEKTMIGGITRFERVYYNSKRSNYANDVFNRIKHPKGKYNNNVTNRHNFSIDIKNSREVYFKTANQTINMIKNGKFRSMARILSLLPKNLRNSKSVRNKIVSAKIQWKNINR